MGPQPLGGVVALVTGGGGGIGSAICRALAGAGATLVITCRHNRTRAETLAGELPGAGHLVARASVDDSEALARLAQRIQAGPGRLDILVNNAGVTRPVPHHALDELDDDLIDTIFRVNVRGAIATTRAMRPLLAAGDQGLVVNISSAAARTALGSNIAYAAGKAALDNLTLSLARALAPNIRVLSVSPGWVEGEYAQRMPPALIQEQRDKTPLGRIAAAEDVAAAVLACATHLRFSTGAIIAVDGGRPLL